MPGRWDFCDWNCLAASSKSWNMLRCIVWMSGNAWPHPLSVCSRLASSYWNMVTCHEGVIFVTGIAWPHPLRVGICWDGLSECLEMLGRILWAFVMLGHFLLEYGDMSWLRDFSDWNCLAASSKSWEMSRWIVWMYGNAWPHPLSVWSCLATSFWNMVTFHGWEILVTGTSWQYPWIFVIPLKYTTLIVGLIELNWDE